LQLPLGGQLIHDAPRLRQQHEKAGNGLGEYETGLSVEDGRSLLKRVHGLQIRNDAERGRPVHRERRPGGGSPDWSRTSNLPVNSRTL
jgi:hypothetical protein